MKRPLALFFLLTITTLLAGQSTAQTRLTMKKLEAERLPDMNLPRAGHNVFYADGELTVVGGHTSGFVMTPTAEYFSDGSWHLLPTVYHHDNGVAVVLDEGRRVLIAGGHEKNLGIGQSYEVEMYDRATHTFNGFGCLDRNRAFAQGVELDSGRVLISSNHKDNDAFELFDGQKTFHDVKDIAVWRSAPYLLPIATDDAIAFGTVWRNGAFAPCNTVDRLKGEPFCVPLLNEWMPILYDQNSHAQEAFIGDKAKGDYSYLIAAENKEGEVAFILVHDNVFSLLPTVCPVPTTTEWGRIKFDRPAIADRMAHKVYLIGNDSTGRVYMVAVEYDKQPAPLTLYYTDPLPDFGDATPVLTPGGDLVITGGIIDDNFAPFASVWLLHTGTPIEKTAMVESHPKATWPWMLGGLLFIMAVVAAILVGRRDKPADIKPIPKEQNDTEPTPLPKPNDVDNGLNSTNDELMTHITQLMENQHLYLNPELKVADVADALGVHSNVISACINAQQGCSFNQFVNNYRLQQAKRLLCQAPDMKISAISLESGFANERSFFRAFKADTDMTPKEWATQQQAIS